MKTAVPKLKIIMMMMMMMMMIMIMMMIIIIIIIIIMLESYEYAVWSYKKQLDPRCGIKHK